jgi:RNA polymerase sigma-70 factor (ECF subfamily)
MQEHDWIRSIQQGNTDDFQYIIDRYKKPIIQYAYGFLGGREDAEDAAEEILIEVFRSAKKYTFSGKLSTWIFTIAYHRCINLKRKKKLRSMFSLDAPDESKKYQDYKDNSPIATPPQVLEKQEQEQIVRRALQQLPDNQRTAVLLAKFENLPLIEIAAVFNMSEGAVKQLLWRAKITLKNLLNNYR